MAISTLNYSKTDVRCAIASQSVFGTANTTQAEFYELHITDMVKIDASSGVLEDATKRSDGSHVETITDVYRNTAGGEYTVQVSGIATKETLAMLIYAVTQDIATEADIDPYQRVFEWDEATTQKIAATGLPNYLLTFLLADPVAAENKQLHTCVVKTLQIDSDPGANAGRMSFTATLYTGFPAVTGSVTCTVADWVDPSQSYFVHQLLQTKTISAADVVCSKFSLSLENEVVRHGFTTTGAPELYAFGTPKVTGSLDVKYDANTVDLPDAYFISPSAAGAADFPVVMVWGATASALYLSFDIWAIYAGDPWERSDNGGALFMTIPFKGLCVPGTTEAIEIKINDGVNRGWIA